MWISSRTFVAITALVGLMIALLLTALPAGAIPPGGVKSRSNGAKVKLSTTSVTQGGVIRVSGTNWRSKGSRNSRRAEVTIKLDDVNILAVLTIRNRRFSGSVRIPRPVRPGRHWLRFLAAQPATSIKSPFFTVRRAR